jgi:hypothetical protein
MHVSHMLSTHISRAAGSAPTGGGSSS